MTAARKLDPVAARMEAFDRARTREEMIEVVVAALDALSPEELARPEVAEAAEWWSAWVVEAVEESEAELHATARGDGSPGPGESLLAWVLLSFPGYQAGWFHRELAEALEWFSAEVAAGRSPRLILEAPPRHGKSLLVSQRWPVWHMANHPGHEVVCASYGADLAKTHSRAARRLAFNGPGRAVWWKEWAGDLLDQADQWEVPNGSKYKAVGVGGAVTGHGAHVLVVDDPLKNSEQARSKTQREKVWTWYTGDAYTRLAPGGGVLVMHTRWHEDDLVGRLLAEERRGGDQWRRIRFPAIAEEDEEHRKEGEALHPERYPLHRLQAIRAVMPAWQWAALYQQRPTPLTGGTFQRGWLTQHWAGRPADLGLERKVVSVDATFKGGDGSDFVVFQSWGSRGAERYLLAQLRARMNYPETKAALRAFVAQEQPDAVIVEDKANGSALVDDLKSEIVGLIAVNPGTKSKEERAEVGAVPSFQAMQVHLPPPEQAPWVGEYVEELCAFPKGANDDQVDATSQALLWLRDPNGLDPDDLDAFLDAFAGA